MLLELPPTRRLPHSSASPPTGGRPFCHCPEDCDGLPSAHSKRETVRMHIRRLGETGAKWAVTAGPIGVACCLAAVGCAHHRADQYAYAPPYAPPVYSQPQVQMPAQPTAYAAAPGGVAAGTLPAGAVVAAPPAAGTIVHAVGGDCPPCSTPGMEGVVMPATMVEGGGQTPPCP